MLSQEARDGGGDEPCRHGFIAPDAYFTGGRIIQVFQFFHALAQIVEHRDAPLEQRPSIYSGLNALRAAVEQLQTECMFQVGNRL